MLKNVRKWAAAVGVVALFSCTSADAGKMHGLPKPADHYYGIYLNGAKVGWMRNRVTVGARVRFDVELEASVGGMGIVSRVELRERRVYRSKDGQLEELEFVQSAATGAVKVRGRRVGDVLKLEIEAGGAVHKNDVKVTDTLEDAMASDRLAQAPNVGAKAVAKRYDPSIQKLVFIEHRVAAVEKRVFGGVTVQAVQIDSKYEDLGIEESSWLDNTGKVLESRVGGFFVARLEPPDVAKRLDFHQDVLINAVVKTPQPLRNTDSIGKMRVRVQGFGDRPPPSSGRQKVSRKGRDVVLEISRDAAPDVSLSAKAAGEVKEYLESTPFIQSDAPEIRKAARQAVGDARDVHTATTRLVEFVFTHVRDEYVPAYSNALEALKTSRGDCTEHSILFVALARSVGIPARVAVGVAYWPPGNGFGWHAWAEVHADGRWYSVDPTWGQAVADATHIKLADGGPAQQAQIVMLLGQLRIVSLEIL
ncbi:transglutaminase family protein [Myxococcota bacterium]